MSTPIDTSGTNQPTGSEPQRSGASNDGFAALFGRLESFLVKAEQALAEWLHHPAAAAASQHIQDAKAHLTAHVGTTQALDQYAATVAEKTAAQAPAAEAAAQAENTQAEGAQGEDPAA